MDYEKIWDDIIEEYGNPNETTKINKIRICKKCHRAEEHDDDGGKCKKCIYKKNNKSKKIYRDIITDVCRQMIYYYLNVNDIQITYRLTKDKFYNFLHYTPEDLKIHLEELGYDKSIHHIDHKIPRSWFKVETPPHIVNDFRNIQPLDSKTNMTKNNK